MIERLSDAAGGILDRDMSDPADIAEAWALLLVIEERALDEFARSAEALAAAGDEDSSQLFLAIRADEVRHLRYCEAVGRRYDPEGFAARADRLRALERKVYGEQSRAWTLYQLDQGMLRLNPVVDWLVRGVIGLAQYNEMPAREPVLAGVGAAEGESLAA